MWPDDALFIENHYSHPVNVKVTFAHEDVDTIFVEHGRVDNVAYTIAFDRREGVVVEARGYLVEQTDEFRVDKIELVADDGATYVMDGLLGEGYGPELTLFADDDGKLTAKWWYE